MPWHANRPPGASDGANEVGHAIRSPAVAGSGAGLVGGACGWGSGMPAPSGQIPPPWAWRENEAPTTRAARRPVPGMLVGIMLALLAPPELLWVLPHYAMLTGGIETGSGGHRF